MSHDVLRSLEGQSVLVVDDEEIVRDVACMIIEENGGATLQAASGADAIEIVQNTQGISCVIIDYSMPVMNGFQTFMAIDGILPQVPVVMISGLVMVPEVAAFEEKRRLLFLPKPFGEKSLVEAIHRAGKLLREG